MHRREHDERDDAQKHDEEADGLRSGFRSGDRLGKTTQPQPPAKPAGEE